MQVSQVSGSIHWVMVVNLVIWTGIFLYLRRLDRRLDRTARDLETARQPKAAPPSEREP
ncbi:MAG TPA: CcmD family protein [Thermoanaerobaculia bacterium]|jgi:CcmD family protein|nr:CcmD family protein [Thermoanaerobaculia bacterium]